MDTQTDKLLKKLNKHIVDNDKEFLECLIDLDDRVKKLEKGEIKMDINNFKKVYTNVCFICKKYITKGWVYDDNKLYCQKCYHKKEK